MLAGDFRHECKQNAFLARGARCVDVICQITQESGMSIDGSV
jgi:hypothetical protein